MQWRRRYGTVAAANYLFFVLQNASGRKKAEVTLRRTMASWRFHFVGRDLRRECREVLRET